MHYQILTTVTKVLKNIKAKKLSPYYVPALL